jgi:hypothetical protein
MLKIRLRKTNRILGRITIKKNEKSKKSADIASGVDNLAANTIGPENIIKNPINAAQCNFSILVSQYRSNTLIKKNDRTEGMTVEEGDENPTLLNTFMDCI